jgi:hypothetical protein
VNGLMLRGVVGVVKDSSRNPKYSFRVLIQQWRSICRLAATGVSISAIFRSLIR